MREITDRNFGFLIAYVLPGYGSLYALENICPDLIDLNSMGVINSIESATVGGFLHVTLISISLGISFSTIRWLLIDSIHHQTGIKKPKWNDSVLQENIDAFETLVDNHYRYYQFYSNSIVILILILSVRMIEMDFCFLKASKIDVILLCLTVLYWLGSRDTLRRYYTRAQHVLGIQESENKNDKRSFHQQSCKETNC